MGMIKRPPPNFVEEATHGTAIKNWSSENPITQQPTRRKPIENGEQLRIGSPILSNSPGAGAYSSLAAKFLESAFRLSCVSYLRSSIR